METISPFVLNVVQVLPPVVSEITGMTVLMEPATYLPGDIVNVAVRIDHVGAAERVEIYAAIGSWIRERYVASQMVDLPFDQTVTGHMAYIPIQIETRPEFPGTYHVYAKTVNRAPGVMSEWLRDVVTVLVTAPPPPPPAEYTLEVSIEPPGAGHVTRRPPEATYTEGSSVELTAVASTGYEFDHWGGLPGAYPALGSTSPTIRITMDSDKWVVAAFREIAAPPPPPPPPTGYELTTSEIPEVGYIKRDPDKTYYDVAEPITLTAIAQVAPFVWSHWEVNGAPPPAQLNPMTIYMVEGGINVVAFFTQP